MALSKCKAIDSTDGIYVVCRVCFGYAVAIHLHQKVTQVLFAFCDLFIEYRKLCCRRWLTCGQPSQVCVEIYERMLCEIFLESHIITCLIKTHVFSYKI